MENKFRIAVLASTKGTDLQAIIDEIHAGRLHAELACVVSNKKGCYAMERAHRSGIKTHFIDPKKKSRVEFDRDLVSFLESLKVDLVVLVGYMRILTPYFVSKFPGRIINVHPALIPKYSGKDFFGKSVHEAVLKSGDKETGMTIHFVEEGVDTGKIILQKTCPVLPGDTPESLKERVQELEKEWYPKVIQQFVEKAEPQR
ncbi:MAG: phosphoribosylglycinamide formyltransferase [Patescibacteria group bacterium]